MAQISELRTPLPPFLIRQSSGFAWQPTIRPVQLVAELTTVPGYLAWISPGMVRGGITASVLDSGV